MPVGAVLAGVGAPLLTGDELTAVARGVGAPGFPGVGPTLYDAVAPELHGLLDGRLFASLVARGVLVPDGDGELLPVPPFGAVLAAALTSRAYVEVRQLVPAPLPGDFVTVAVLAGDAGVVRHTAAEPFHSLELAPDTTTLASALLNLVSASSAAPPPVPDAPRRTAVGAWRGTALAVPCGSPTRRRYRGRLSGLAELVPPPERGWRRATALWRTDDAGEGVRVEGFVAVFDGGDDGVWLVGEDPDGEAAPDGHAPDGHALDRAVVAESVAAADVPPAIEAFAAMTVTVPTTARER